MKKMDCKGFTLVEIMIVVAIIGILAAIAIPNFVQSRKKSQANACISNMKQIEGAVEQYMMNKSTTTYPALAAIAGGADKLIKVTPVCPAGGTYTMPTASTRTSCSIAASQGDDYKHELPAMTASE